jgi:hypothetical protein
MPVLRNGRKCGLDAPDSLAVTGGEPSRGKEKRPKKRGGGRATGRGANQEPQPPPPPPPPPPSAQDAPPAAVGMSERTPEQDRGGGRDADLMVVARGGGKGEPANGDRMDVVDGAEEEKEERAPPAARKTDDGPRAIVGTEADATAMEVGGEPEPVASGTGGDGTDAAAPAPRNGAQAGEPANRVQQFVGSLRQGLSSGFKGAADLLMSPVRMWERRGGGEGRAWGFAP